jgi:hypothetical protein
VGAGVQRLPARRAAVHRPDHRRGQRMSTSQIVLRLTLGVLALVGGIVAAVVAIDVVRTVLS